MTDSSATSVLAGSLRFSGGFHADDRAHVLEVLAPLEKHLARWSADEADLQVSVKDRGGPEQRVTLDLRLPGWPALVAKGADVDLDRALHEARKELMRQIEDERSRRDPKDNRKLRQDRR
jgi:ribosome-associated translation inhibitor RaiA